MYVDAPGFSRSNSSLSLESTLADLSARGGGEDMVVSHE